MNENGKDEDQSSIRNKLFAFKGLALIGSADIIGTAISAIFWLTIASLLLVEEYGEISYFLAIASMGTCCVAGSPQALMVYSTKYQKIIPTLLLLTLIFTVVASLIAFVIIQRFEIIFSQDLADLRLFRFHSYFFKFFSILIVLLVNFSSHSKQ